MTSLMDTWEMPVLKPIKIPTKNAKLSWPQKIQLWLTQPRTFQLQQDWIFPLRENMVVIIRQGFIFDGASIPRPLWGFLNPYGIMLVQGLLHDYAYQYDRLVVKSYTVTSDLQLRISGEQATYGDGAGQKFWDKMFLEVGIRVNGLKRLNYLAYYALRLFGFVAWNKYRTQEDSDLFR